MGRKTGGRWNWGAGRIPHNDANGLGLAPSAGWERIAETLGYNPDFVKGAAQGPDDLSYWGAISALPLFVQNTSNDRSQP